MVNTLYYGDNLAVLRESIRSETVDLIYLDPPFNSNASYNVLFERGKGDQKGAQIKAFDDTWQWDDLVSGEALREVRQSSYQNAAQMLDAVVGFLGKNAMTAYLCMMAVRLIELHRVLKPTGSLYLHCDPTASHYLKVLLDAVFGAKGYRNEIIWKRTSAHSDGGRYGRNTDTILFYSKGKTWTWNQPFLDYEASHLDRFRFTDADGRKWTDDNLTAKGLSGGGYTYEYKGVTSLWRVPRETMERLDAEGRLHFTRAGGLRLKRYLDEAKGMPAQSLWTDIPPINSQAQERMGYPTQKPVALLERIINASSNPGDVVLDPFCGCGTTVHAAQKLNRHWIGIDVTHVAISLIETRLFDAFQGDAKFRVVGVPADVKGAQDLFDRDDRTKKEFEKWACGLIRAYPKDGGKKGADGGVDGFFRFGRDKEHLAIVSIKGGRNVDVKAVRELDAVVKEQRAQLGVLVTLHGPTAPMRDWAKSAGVLRVEGYPAVPRLQIVTVEEALEKKDRAVDAPLRHADTYRAAPREEDGSRQGLLEL